MSQTLITPSLFTDIHRVNREFKEVLKQNKATDKRDYLCFSLPYLLGRSCSSLLAMSFKELHLELKSPYWKVWLNDFEAQINKKTPWFHTARFQSLRDGLSRRGLEVIIKNQSQTYPLEGRPWSYKSLRQAYVLKSLQTGMDELKIRFYLGMSDRYSFKPYYKYLESHKESDHLYLEIHP